MPATRFRRDCIKCDGTSQDSKFYPLLGSKNSLHQSLPRIQTALQPPGAEIERPAKMVAKRWGKKVDGEVGGNKEEVGSQNSVWIGVMFHLWASFLSPADF
jgi:hypothetical protein